jgi:CRISPR-associated protein Csm4
MLDSLYLIRLRFTTPLHLGTSRAEYDRAADYLHSDTFYSAILQAWADLGLAHPALQAESNSTGADLRLGFVLSSLFPFRKVEGEEPQYFFPVPLGLLAEATGRLDLAQQKRVKKLRFLEHGLFADLLRRGVSENLLADLESKIPAPASDFMCLGANQWTRTFYEKETVSRNHVPPTDWWGAADTEIFYVERLRFDRGCGLFGLVHLENPEVLPELKTALRYLQDEGLGSDRHAGHGLFELEFGPAPDALKALFQATTDSPYRLNLSLFCPSREDLPQMVAGSQVRYRLKKRGGWIGHAPYLSLRKNAVYMFEEGSILQTDRLVAGKTVNLRPNLSALGPGVPEVEHPIFRIGRSLFVPVNLSTHET